MGDMWTLLSEERGLSELRLASNGLKVLLVPDPSVPVVASCIVYHVGSRNEAVGHTGATHLLEHLMFKGSRKFDSSLGTGVARMLERIGAAFNATTWFDRTNYYEIVPPEHLSLALELEADRMRFAALRAEDLASEMMVVRNEYQRGENDPFDVLLKESFAMAFREHPYHHPTIGWRSDIENISIERLREFYNTFYYPDNATLILVGTFDREHAMAEIVRHFGPLPGASRPLPRVVTQEPPQEGERRFVLRRSGEVGWVVTTWRAPEAAHSDTHVLAVLADALSGGVTSRLFQRLVETGKCLDVQAFAWQLRDPGLFQVFAALNPPTEHAEVEQIIRDEIAGLAEIELSAAELERAKAQVEAQTAYHRDSPAQVASALAEAISSVDWRFYLDYPERIQAVTVADVTRVAALVFKDDSISVGYFIPKKGGAGGETTADPEPQLCHPGPCFFRTGLADVVVEHVFDNGARLLLLPRHSNTTVHVQGSLLAGHGMVQSPMWSAASVLPDMVERGTANYDRMGLARALEDRGIELAISGESFNPLEAFISGRCLARHLPLVIDVVFEMLRRPTFPAPELEKLRQLRLGELSQVQEDTFLRAFEVFSRLLFPPGHPYCFRTIPERREALQRLSVGDLQTLHSDLYGPASLVLSLVGDFVPEEVVSTLGERLADWHGGRGKAPEVERFMPKSAEVGQAMEFLADKPNLDVLFGHPGGLRRRDEDYIAALLANAVLGQSTLSSRLGRRLRDRDGLTYGVVSRFFGASLIDGPWAVSFSIAPENLDQGIAAAREEIERLVKEGPSDSEVEDEKAAMAGSYRLSLATPAGIAREMARLARHQLPMSEMDRLPSKIASLTRAAVVAAIERHMDPDHLSLSVAGQIVAKRGPQR